MRRCWTWFRSLEDWAQASITCATIALAFLAIIQVRVLAQGDRPFTSGALWEPILVLLLVYLWCLIAWGGWYHRQHYRSSLGREFGAVFIAFEAIARSVQAVVAVLATPARHIARNLHSRRDGTEKPER